LKNGPNSRPGSANAQAAGLGRPPPYSSIQNAVAAPPLAAVNTGRVFRLIGSANPESFLAHDELKRFVKIQPPGHPSAAMYTRDNMRRFERKVEEIKNVARDVVKPLTRNCLELDLRSLSDGPGGGLGYLTCIRCEEGELPWEM